MILIRERKNDKYKNVTIRKLHKATPGSMDEILDGFVLLKKWHNYSLVSQNIFDDNETPMFKQSLIFHLKLNKTIDKIYFSLKMQPVTSKLYMKHLNDLLVACSVLLANANTSVTSHTMRRSGAFNYIHFSDRRMTFCLLKQFAEWHKKAERDVQLRYAVSLNDSIFAQADDAIHINHLAI